MRTYQVTWTEKMAVNVKANNKLEACEMILNCEHDENAVFAEIDTAPEAYLQNKMQKKYENI